MLSYVSFAHTPEWKNLLYVRLFLLCEVLSKELQQSEHDTSLPLDRELLRKGTGTCSAPLTFVFPCTALLPSPRHRAVVVTRQVSAEQIHEQTMNVCAALTGKCSVLFTQGKGHLHRVTGTLSTPRTPETCREAGEESQHLSGTERSRMPRYLQILPVICGTQKVHASSLGLSFSN